jgi:acyl-CoA thioester hydrolase
MSLPDSLIGYPTTARVAVAWGDMDALQHVNNLVYLRWFETARIAFFGAIGWWDIMNAGGVGPILAKTSCVFRAPVTFPDTIIVGAKATDIASDRFTMQYVVYSEALGRTAALGDARIVSFDYQAGCKAPIPHEVYARLLETVV